MSHRYVDGYEPDLNRMFGRYCATCGVLFSLHDERKDA